MKNKNTILLRLGAGAFVIALVFAVNTASAQNPRPYPALKTGINNGVSPSPKADKKTEATATSLSSKDKSFMKAAANGGTMEVEWGKVAAQKGQNADVKKFGNRMVTDHSKANNELMSLASKKGVQLSPSKPNVKWKSDKDYMDMMVKDHEKDLSEFQGEASGGSDPDLKKFAENTSKVVQKHLSMAKEIQGKLK
jgi:putative membrane protein